MENKTGVNYQTTNSASTFKDAANKIVNTNNLSNFQSGINNYDRTENYWKNDNNGGNNYSNPSGVKDDSYSNGGYYNSPEAGGLGSTSYSTSMTLGGEYPSEVRARQMREEAMAKGINGTSKPSIVAVHKNQVGIITDYKLSDGRILDKEQAVMVAETEGIEGVNVGRTRGVDHTKMLRANPTNDVSKALDNLPTF